MKTMSPAALDVLASGRAVVSGAVKFSTPEPVRLWGGFGEITIDGEVYLPLGERGVVQTTSGSVGAAAEATTLVLSDVPPENMAVLNTKILRGVPVTIRRLIFDENGRELLDDSVHLRGRVDYVTRARQAGGDATVSISVEGSARGLGRSSGRMRTDADQRLILATDGGFKHVAYAGDRVLYWGGKIPQQARTAVGGGKYVRKPDPMI